MSVLKIPIWPELGANVPMTFLHGEPGWYLWMLHRPDPDLNRTERDLMLLYNNGDLKDFPPEVSAEPGIYICTLTESKLIRGLILNKYKNVVPEEGSVIILDVDSGKVLSVPKNNIKVLPTFASKAPARAVRCDLGLDCKERFDWPSQIDDMIRKVLSDTELLVTFESERPGSIPTVSVSARLSNPATGSAIDFRVWLTQYFQPFLEINSLNGYVPEPLFNKPDQSDCQLQLELPKVEEAPSVTPDSLRPNHWNPYAEQFIPNPIFSQVTPPPGFGPQSCFYPQANFNPLAALMLSQGFSYPQLPWTPIWPNSTENYSSSNLCHTPVTLPQIHPQSLPSTICTQESTSRVASSGCLPVTEVVNGNILKNNNPEGGIEALVRNRSPVLTVESLLEESPTLKKKTLQENVSTSLIVDSLRASSPAASSAHTPLLTPKSSAPKAKVVARAVRPIAHGSRNNLNRQIGSSQVVLKEVERDWRVGDVVHVMMSYVHSPEFFSANVIDIYAKDFDPLQKEMCNYNGTLPLKVTSKEEAFEILGNFCVCYDDEDNSWFRAEILDWHFDDPKRALKVWAVDFGGICEIPLAWIRRLKGRAALIYMQCTLFTMHNVRPRKPLLASEWPEEHCAEFRKMMPVNSQFWLQIEKPISEGIWPVSVYTDSNCLTPSLNCTLVEKQLAFYHNSLPEPDQPSINAIPTRTDWDPMRDDFERCGRDYNYDDEDASVAVCGYKPRDEKNVCRFFVERGHCPKGLNCRQRHVSLKQGMQEQHMVYTTAFNDLDLPEEGSEFSMLITKIMNVHHFFGIRIPDKVTSKQEHYQMLIKQMNDPQEVKSFQYCRISPAFGEMVIAKGGDNGLWFRGRVIDVDHNSEERFEVQDVDSGIVRGIEKKDMREMIPDFLHLPFQALECFLADMVPVLKGPDILNKGCDLVDQLVRKQKVKVRVVKKTIEEALEVKITVNCGGNGQAEDLASILLSKGYIQNGAKRIASKDVYTYRPG